MCVCACFRVCVWGGGEERESACVSVELTARLVFSICRALGDIHQDGNKYSGTHF